MSSETIRHISTHEMTTEQFVDKYYKPDRLNRTPGTRDRIIHDRQSDIRNNRTTLISHHDSVTGRTMILYNPT
jgi:hypothetical protein